MDFKRNSIIFALMSFLLLICVECMLQTGLSLQRNQKYQKDLWKNDVFKTAIEIVDEFKFYSIQFLQWHFGVSALKIYLRKHFPFRAYKI